MYKLIVYVKIRNLLHIDLYRQENILCIFKYKTFVRIHFDILDVLTVLLQDMKYEDEI